MDLQRNATTADGVVRFDYKDVISILKHSLLSGLLGESDKESVNEIVKTNLTRVPSERFIKSESLSQIFKKALTPAELSDYFKDILSLIALTNERKGDKSTKNKVQDNIRNEFIYRIVLSIKGTVTAKPADQAPEKTNDNTATPISK